MSKTTTGENAIRITQPFEADQLAGVLREVFYQCCTVVKYSSWASASAWFGLLTVEGSQATLRLRAVLLPIAMKRGYPLPAQGTHPHADVEGCPSTRCCLCEPSPASTACDLT